MTGSNSLHDDFPIAQQSVVAPPLYDSICQYFYRLKGDLQLFPDHLMEVGRERFASNWNVIAEEQLSVRQLMIIIEGLEDLFKHCSKRQGVSEVCNFLDKSFHVWTDKATPAIKAFNDIDVGRALSIFGDMTESGVWAGLK